ncbi:MAG TPA: YhjD/YihY/BrkB family envelope integrity protein [Solirubrobacteraceae bacterium]|nr:YhjD/YihY/BrkB family envelope integrity protein [Solirubrobacteraceae bacterium]
MAEPVPVGSDVSSGTYSCTRCNYKLSVGPTQHMPPCPECGNGRWRTFSGDVSVDGRPNGSSKNMTNARVSSNGQAADHAKPDQPTDLPRSAWRGVLKRTLKEYKADNVGDLAAALTYYGVLAIFPMIIVIVSILGLIGHSVTRPLIDNLGKVAPGPAKQIFTSAIQNVQTGKGTAGVLFIVGLAAALWSASGYVSAFMRASNVVWDIEEGRPIWKTLPIRLAVTLTTVLLLTVSAVAVVFTGGLATQAAHVLGLGSSFVTIFDIVKWPILLLIVAVILAVLYYAGPNVRQPGIRWVSPGSVLAILLWILASAAFALYVASFASYNKTYGALGGVVVFLVWLWITNVAILLGAELNAELERGRQIQGGHPIDKEPYLPARDEPK